MTCCQPTGDRIRFRRCEGVFDDVEVEPADIYSEDAWDTDIATDGKYIYFRAASYSSQDLTGCQKAPPVNRKKLAPDSRC